LTDRSPALPAVRPATDVVARRVDDGMVLVHLATNQIFELNDTGARIWELLSTGRDSDGVVVQLMQEYGLDRNEATRAFRDLVDELQVGRLVDAG
jgi:hypothetical protein